MDMLYQKIAEIIQVIMNSEDYLECIRYQDEISNDSFLSSLIDECKKMQKEYLYTQSDDTYGKLCLLQEQLFSHPIYSIYLRHLDAVNEMINYVKNELNLYFDEVMNFSKED